MSAITLEIPEIILESYQQNINIVKDEAQRGMVIWEYLNGHLSLRECAQILHISYRGFLELLWNKGIAIDGLNESELDQQILSIRGL